MEGTKWKQRSIDLEDIMELDTHEHFGRAGRSDTYLGELVELNQSDTYISELDGLSELSDTRLELNELSDTEDGAGGGREILLAEEKSSLGVVKMFGLHKKSSQEKFQRHANYHFSSQNLLNVFDDFVPVQERLTQRKPHEMPNRRCKEQFKTSRDEAVQRRLFSQFEIQEFCDNLVEVVVKTLKDVRKSHKKSTTTRAPVAEPSLFINEKPKVSQDFEKEQFNYPQQGPLLDTRKRMDADLGPIFDEENELGPILEEEAPSITSINMENHLCFDLGTTLAPLSPNPQEHCKELGIICSVSDLFVKFSFTDIRRFGLEKDNGFDLSFPNHELITDDLFSPTCAWKELMARFENVLWLKHVLYVLEKETLISDLNKYMSCTYDPGKMDLRTNPFQEGGNNAPWIVDPSQDGAQLDPTELVELNQSDPYISELDELSELSDTTFELNELSDTEDEAGLVAGRNGSFSAQRKIHNKFNLDRFYTKFDQAFGDGLLPIFIKKYQQKKSQTWSDKGSFNNTLISGQKS
uniref:Uncharacterized protein n=1 Tax=Brassica oleracea TaxID=3712 RepID=A0A3P6EMB1_BRAOL|nr:unnamed protein product [Brassica oleracea]